MREPVIRRSEFGGRLVKAVGGLRYIRGNQKPYFTLCMESYRNGKEDEFGAASESLVRLWPELKPLADLHLSDIDGAPMHAEANGWYWLAGAAGGLGEQHHGGNGSPERSSDECLAILAKHLRIEMNAARGLVVAAIDLANERGPKAAREMFSAYIESCRPRWSEEAAACISGLGLQVFGDQWDGGQRS